MISEALIGTVGQLRGERGNTWIRVLSGIVLVIVIIAIVSGGNSKTSKHATSSSAVPHAQPISPSAAKPAAKTSAPAPKSSATPAPNQNDLVAARVIVWYRDFGSIFTTLSNDLTNVSNAAQSGNVSEAGAACQTLASDLQTAQAYPAIPDPQIAADWSTGVADLASSAQDCVNGAENDDVGLIEQSATEMQQGVTAIGRAANDVQTLTNSVGG